MIGHIGHIGRVAVGDAHDDRELVPGFDAVGVLAFTTTRHRGSFALHGTEPAGEVFGRWKSLVDELAPHAERLATSHQVHGDTILTHEGEWRGWLRSPAADGHVALRSGTALAVTVADCVPVFMAHPGGAVAVVHSGWKGTLANVTRLAIEQLVASGLQAQDLLLHCGPSICGSCYEVAPDVYAQLTGKAVPRPTPIDLRALIAAHARAAGVVQISISAFCTRCHNDRFFSHRCGDAGRQLGVIARR
ncbi:MAG: polyphenol oxidase family protein [Gemmatimonadota bacterium]